MTRPTLSAVLGTGGRGIGACAVLESLPGDGRLLARAAPSLPAGPPDLRSNPGTAPGAARE